VVSDIGIPDAYASHVANSGVQLVIAGDENRSSNTK